MKGDVEMSDKIKRAKNAALLGILLSKDEETREKCIRGLALLMGLEEAKKLDENGDK